MRRYRVRQLSVFSFARLVALMGALLGLVGGVVYAFGGLMTDLAVSLSWARYPDTPGLSWGSVLAFGALIGMPLIGAALAFFLGALGAILYNLFALKFGGINLEFKPTDD